MTDVAGTLLAASVNGRWSIGPGDRSAAWVGYGCGLFSDGGLHGPRCAKSGAGAKMLDRYNADPGISRSMQAA